MVDGLLHCGFHSLISNEICVCVSCSTMNSKTAEEAAAVSETGQKFDYSGDAFPTVHPHSLD